MTTPGSQPFSDTSLERVLSAADGYAELGLPDLAWDEVNSLPDSVRARAEVQEAMLGLFIRQQRWIEAVETGRRLCIEAIASPCACIHTAYALHELRRTDEARVTLLSGPDSLRDEPVFHYNLACYLAVAGKLKDAEVSLRTAFRMDESLRLHARLDPDLKPFREIL